MYYAKKHYWQAGFLHFICYVQMKFYLMIKLRIVSKSRLFFFTKTLCLYAKEHYIGFLLVCVMYRFCMLWVAFIPIS